MNIQHLTLHSNNLAAQKTFFADALGLPILSDDDTHLTVKIGASRLTWQHAAIDGHYHYAFDVPRNQFQEALTWLASRAEILADAQGRTDFHHVDWNAHAVYFRDADGNVGELIARHNLPTERMMPFSSESLLRISEIGLATPHVLDTVASIQQGTGLRVWRGAGSETFTALGDEWGLMIITQEGRNWLPTNDTPAVPLPTSIQTDSVTLDFTVPHLPYQVQPTLVSVQTG